MKKIIVSILVAAILGGCSAMPKPVLTPRLISVPDELTACQGRPKTLSGSYTQKDVARYVARLKNAHGDCKGDLGALNETIQAFNNVQKVKKK